MIRTSFFAHKEKEFIRYKKLQTSANDKIAKIEFGNHKFILHFQKPIYHHIISIII